MRRPRCDDPDLGPARDAGPVAAGRGLLQRGVPRAGHPADRRGAVVARQPGRRLVPAGDRAVQPLAGELAGDALGAGDRAGLRDEFPDRADRDAALRRAGVAHRLRAGTAAAARAADHRAARAGADHPARHRARDGAGIDVHPPRIVAHGHGGRSGADRRVAAVHDPDRRRDFRGRAAGLDRRRPEPRRQPVASGPRRPDPAGAAWVVCRRAVHLHRQPGGGWLDLHRRHAVCADAARPPLGVPGGPVVNLHLRRGRHHRAAGADDCAAVRRGADAQARIPGRGGRKSLMELLATRAGRPLISAHRGFAAAAPENTLPALDLAWRAGATVADIDVQLTRDGRVVVMHDRSVTRTTNGSGLVRDLTFGELKALDAGAWFDRKFAGERLPALAEVLDWSRGRLGFLIELKNYPHREMPLVEKTIAEIEAPAAKTKAFPAASTPSTWPRFTV